MQDGKGRTRRAGRSGKSLSSDRPSSDGDDAAVESFWEKFFRLPEVLDLLERRRVNNAGPPSGLRLEIKRDEAKVLGLLAAVRVHGTKILPHEEPGTTAKVKGKWIAARWQGRVHVPFWPAIPIIWTPRSWKVAKGRTLAGPLAMLWVPDDGGEPLEPDRVANAVGAIQLIEFMYADEAAGVAFLRRVCNALTEAHKGGCASTNAKHALRAAQRHVRREIANWEGRQAQLERAVAVLEGRFQERLRPPVREPQRLLVLPIIEELALLREEASATRYVPGLNPLDVSDRLEAAVDAGPAELAVFRTELAALVSRRPHANASAELMLSFALFAEGWSECSAARLWCRARYGPSPVDERAMARALYTAWGARLKAQGD